MVAQYVSRSSLELEKFVAEVGVLKLAGETGIHRTMLWRYSTGRSKPDADQIAKLHRASGGRVAADGWETIAQPEPGGEQPTEEPEDPEAAEQAKSSQPAAE